MDVRGLKLLPFLTKIMKNKKKIEPVCNHKWEDLYIFKTIDGMKYLQQKCMKCHEMRYVQLSENDQNGSNKGDVR